jgi:hypothetical protein
MGPSGQGFLLAPCSSSYLFVGFPLLLALTLLLCSYLPKPPPLSLLPPTASPPPSRGRAAMGHQRAAASDVSCWEGHVVCVHE